MRLIRIFSFSLILLSSLPVLAERRIINGGDTVKGAWPWMVSLQIDDIGHHCGGTLIDPYWVLTAAHCLDNLDASFSLRVAIGLYQNSNLEDSELIQVSRFFQHPDWDTYNYDSPNDVALLLLSRPSTSPLVKLASPEQRLETSGLLSIALGWGVTHVRAISFSDTLQQVDLPLVSLETCRQAYSGNRHLISSQLCAGFAEGGKDTCFGDSGGPLVVFDGVEWLQVGITSDGGQLGGSIPCADRDAYGIYSKVSAFLDFVDNHLLSDVSFTNAEQFSASERWHMQLVEKNPNFHPRPSVDIWFGVVYQEALWFISGSAQQPVLSSEPRPWAQQVSAAQTEHTVLDIPAANAAPGTYPVYAIFTKAGQGFTPVALQSGVVSQVITIVP